MTLPPRWQYTSPEQALADARNGTLARHVRAYIDALDEYMAETGGTSQNVKSPRTADTAGGMASTVWRR